MADGGDGTWRRERPEASIRECPEESTGHNREYPGLGRAGQSSSHDPQLLIRRDFREFVTVGNITKRARGPAKGGLSDSPYS